MSKYRLRIVGTRFLKKAATLLLLFSFIFLPTATAQETPVESVIETPAPEPTPTENTIEESDVTPTQETETVEEQPVSGEPPSESEIPPEPEALMSGTSDTEGGAIFINNETTKSVVPDVDTQTGALTYKYNLVLPPGRNDMTPDLALVYNSGAIDNTSSVGYGWSVSIPYIERMNKYGSDQLYATSTTYSSSLDGELVRMGTSSSEYKPKVENGAFRRYTLVNNVWTVLEKDGKEFLFGTTTSGRKYDSASTTRIFSWHLEESRDTNENYIEYSYYKDANEIYPDTISYTGNISTDGPFTVTFTREVRNDNLSSNETGFMATTTYRISRIETAISGSWVGRYDLGYAAGHNGNRSLLSTIIRSGRDEAGTVTTLPAVNLSYETFSTADKEWTEDAGWYVPVNIARDREGYDDGARFVDINGDTLPDIIQSAWTAFSPSATPLLTELVMLNTGSGWATSTAWDIPAPIEGRFGFAGGYMEETGQGDLDNGARFADVNKDGFTDILWAYSVEGNYMASPPIHYEYDISSVYINNGTNTWATTTNWALPNEFLFAFDAIDAGGRVADVNGDGLPDLLRSTTERNEVYLNTGTGWQQVASSTWVVPEPFVAGNPGSPYPAGTQIVDINGDGLADIVRAYESEFGGGDPDVHRVHLNTGNGWATTTLWSTPIDLARQDSVGNRFVLSTQLLDVNGDSLVDFIDNDNVYLNTGEGWTIDTNWTDPPYFKFGYIHNGYHYTEAGVASMDADGDNMIDFVKSGPLSTHPTYPHDKGVYVHDGKVPDLLREIEYPEGGDITATYKQSALYATGGNRANGDIPFNLNTVNTLAYDDDETSPYLHTYFYGGGDLYYASSTDNKFAGFATTTKTDARGNVTKTYIHQGNGSQTSLGEYNDNVWKIGEVFLTEKYDDSNNLYTRSINRIEHASTSTTTAFVYPTREVSQYYDGDADHKDIAIEYVYNTSTGNVATTTEWGEVTGLADGTFTDTGSDKRTTAFAYATSALGYLASLPYQVSVADQANVKVRELRTYYDNESLGGAMLGNVTRKDEWATTTTYVSTRITNSAFGLPLTISDPRYATTTYSYDTLNLYPKLTTNALSQTASSTYDYSLGKAKLTTDANNFMSEWIFDGLDRVITEKLPDPDTGVRGTIRTNTYTDTRNSVAVQTDLYLSASTSVPVYTYFDGFGRKMQERSKAETEDEYSVRDWTYGEDGFLAEESLPYFDTDEDNQAATTTNELFTTYNYDPLGRLTSVETAVGDTDIVYDQWQEAVTDALGNVKTYGYDAYERLTSVLENNGGSTYTTTYEWNLNNKLTKVTDALANIRNFTYDGLGRRLTSQDLHDIADVTFGTWQFTYDNSGNITQVVDPKSQSIQNTYDLLNRQLTEDYTGAAGTEITYTYDSCAKGIGMLCTASSTGAMVSNAYTSNGLLASTTEVITGIPYITHYTYDRAGNQLTITYPDGGVVRYVYNAGGRIETVEAKESIGAYGYIIRDFDYGPHGKVTHKEFANGVRTDYVYDPEALYRLLTIISDN